MPSFKPLLLGGAGLLLALVMACGGDDSADPTPSDAGNSTNGAVTNSDGGNASGGTITEVNLTESAARLSDLSSFRFDLSMSVDFGDGAAEGQDDELAAAMLAMFGNIRAEGAYVAPDRMSIDASFLGQEFGYIQIGDEAWEKLGDSWQPTTVESAPLTFDDPSSFFTDLLPNEVLEVAETSSESINGVDATRYSFDKESLEAAAAALGENTAEFGELTRADLDLWLTDDGIPVKLLMDISGTDEGGSEVSLKMEMNVSDINSDSVKIERPQ